MSEESSDFLIAQITRLVALKRQGLTRQGSRWVKMGQDGSRNVKQIWRIARAWIKSQDENGRFQQEVGPRNMAYIRCLHWLQQEQGLIAKVIQFQDLIGHMSHMWIRDVLQQTCTVLTSVETQMPRLLAIFLPIFAEQAMQSVRSLVIAGHTSEVQTCWLCQIILTTISSIFLKIPELWPDHIRSQRIGASVAPKSQELWGRQSCSRIFVGWWEQGAAEMWTWKQWSKQL